MNIKKIKSLALKKGEKLLCYKIKKMIGFGGTGIVYLAKDMNLNREVAIKEYLPLDIVTRVENKKVTPIEREYKEIYDWGMERFMKEAYILSQFKHKNIIKINHVFKKNKTAYMVMDYTPGISFKELINSHQQISEKQLKDILFSIIDGLRVVHDKGMIHRDIKPANIYLPFEHEPVILDFGSACYKTDENSSMVYTFSRGYTPIEQYYLDEGVQGVWSDIYALGATMYHAITGYSPTDANKRYDDIEKNGADSYIPLMNMNIKNYSKNLVNIIDSTLQFKTKDRPQNLTELAIKLSFDDPNKSLNMKNHKAHTKNFYTKLKQKVVNI